MILVVWVVLIDSHVGISIVANIDIPLHRTRSYGTNNPGVRHLTITLFLRPRCCIDINDVP